ncbi:MAG: hypothetical protein ABIT96_12585 [Ferruginibacter sp.]
MKANEIMLAGVAGTTAFTLFSIGASHVCNENFEEPELLGDMIYPLTPLRKKPAKLTGWVTHYLVGIALAAFYKIILQSSRYKPTISSGLLAGAITGYPASLVWDAVLRVHPQPARPRTTSFYVQLTIGHAILGAVIFAVFKSFEKREGRKTANKLK